MRTVLVLAYYFPPCGTVGGLRTLAFCRHLPRSGWRPVVLAAEHPGATPYARDGDPGGTVVRIPGKADLLDRLLWGTDARRRWMREAWPAARELVRKEKPDAILASFTPVADLEIAARLKEEFRLPVVLDFRDAWTTNPGRPYRLPWQRPYEARRERRLLGQADAVSAATEPIERDLRAAGARRTATIPNGYDEADFASPDPGLPEDVWRITYVGAFYAGMTLEPLARALAPLGHRVRLRVVGGLPEARRRAVMDAGMGDRLEIVPPVSHPEAIREIRASHALLLLLWSGPGTAAIHSTKTFEYLRSGRPVLGLIPPGEARKLLEERGHPVLSPEASPEEIRAILKPWVERTPEPRLADEGLKAYDRKRSAAALARLLEEACAC